MADDRVYEAIVAGVIKALREERERQGISMNQLAIKAGLSQSMVSLVERDLRNPTLDTLLRIARVLKLDLGKVISQVNRSLGSQIDSIMTNGYPVADEALHLLEELQPEGMSLDINLRSKFNGFDVLAKVAELSPATSIHIGLCAISRMAARVMMYHLPFYSPMRKLLPTCTFEVSCWKVGQGYGRAGRD